MTNAESWAQYIRHVEQSYLVGVATSVGWRLLESAEPWPDIFPHTAPIDAGLAN